MRPKTDSQQFATLKNLLIRKIEREKSLINNIYITTMKSIIEDFRIKKVHQQALDAEQVVLAKQMTYLNKQNASNASNMSSPSSNLTLSSLTENTSVRQIKTNDNLDLNFDNDPTTNHIFSDKMKNRIFQTYPDQNSLGDTSVEYSRLTDEVVAAAMNSSSKEEYTNKMMELANPGPKTSQKIENKKADNSQKDILGISTKTIHGNDE
jgi:hypothetical protein